MGCSTNALHKQDSVPLWKSTIWWLQTFQQETPSKGVDPEMSKKLTTHYLAEPGRQVMQKNISTQIWQVESSTRRTDQFINGCQSPVTPLLVYTHLLTSRVTYISHKPSPLPPSTPPPSTHTLTSLATIHQCTSVWLWQLPPAQSSAHHHARPGMKRCWCSEHQLQRIIDTDRTLGATVLSLGAMLLYPWCDNTYFPPLPPSPPFSIPISCSFSLASSGRSSSSTGTRKEAGAHPIRPPTSTIHQPGGRDRGREGEGERRGRNVHL